MTYYFLFELTINSQSIGLNKIILSK